MRLAIADPPYLGRAALWYGGKGRNKQGRAGRACGRGDLAPVFRITPAGRLVPRDPEHDVDPETGRCKHCHTTVITTIKRKAHR